MPPIKSLSCQPEMKNVRIVLPEHEANETDELRRLAMSPAVPKSRKEFRKQLSMCETSRQAAWEKRRQQIEAQERSYGRFSVSDDPEGFRSPRFTARSLTDEDLDELKGCIDLGFGFKEDEDDNLCNTLPALDLYFAVKRQFSDPKLQRSPSQVSSSDSFSGGPSSALGSPRSPQSESWKICNPGDNPQHVKTRLRHWAQAVACSVRQSC